MSKRNLFMAAGVAVAASSMLAACGEYDPTISGTHQLTCERDNNVILDLQLRYDPYVVENDGRVTVKYTAHSGSNVSGVFTSEIFQAESKHIFPNDVACSEQEITYNPNFNNITYRPGQ